MSESKDLALSGHNRLLDLVADGKVSTDQLKELMELQERHDANEAKKAFNIAMSNFQGKCPIIAKSKKVDFSSKGGNRVKYNYSPLEEIVRVIKPILDEFSLGFYFNTEELDKNRTKLETTITHAAGHSVTTSRVFPTVHDDGRMNQSQREKSALSFAKRAGLENALGIITADEDDDATGTTTQLASEQQIQQVRGLVELTGSQLDKVLQYVRAESLETMTDTDAKKAINALKSKARQ